MANGSRFSCPILLQISASESGLKLVIVVTTNLIDKKEIYYSIFKMQEAVPYSIAPIMTESYGDSLHIR